MNVLIVEAKARFRDELARRLARPDVRTVVASSDNEALRLLKREDIDVALVGLETNKREGLGLLRRMKRARPMTEVILMVRDPDVRLGIEAMKLGAFDDIRIPFDMEKLRGMMDAALARRQERKASQRTLGQRLQDVFAAVGMAEGGLADEALRLANGKRSARPAPLERFLSDVGLAGAPHRYGVVQIEPRRPGKQR